MELTILKWNKYNPRKDIKHPSWFALSNRFLEDPDLFGFEPIDLKAMLYLFCQASQRNSPDITVNFSHAERVCLIKSKNLKAAIEKLSKIGAVRIRTDHERARTQTSRDTTDNTLQTIQDTTGQNTITAVSETSEPAAVETGNWNEFVSPKSESELIRALPKETLERWAKLHPDAEFLNRELIKAFGYYQTNPKKCPHSRRGWANALSSWFERGWGKHASKIAGVKPDDAKLAEWIKAGDTTSQTGTQRTLESVLAIAGGRA